MTDPYPTPSDRPVEPPVEPTHQTTINVAPERRSGGSGMAFIIGGLVVLVAVIAAVVFFRGSPVKAPDPAKVDIDVNLPDAPKLPDAPDLTPSSPQSPAR